MLTQLRKKFILINMGFVGLVLLCVFASVCTSSYQSWKTDIEKSLQLALTVKKDPVNKPPQQEQPEPEHWEKAPYTKFASICAVLADKEGNLLQIVQESDLLTESELEQAALSAFSAVPAFGKLDSWNLYYRKQNTPDGIRIAFADSSYLAHSLRNLLITSLLIGLCSMVAMFFISLFLSKWALRPVEKAWKQQQQFVADASHELKTPLTVILANNNILFSHPEKTVAQQRKWLESTAEEATHMKKLVDDLLFLAQSDDQQTTQRHMEELDWSELTWNMLLQWEPIAYEKQIHLTSEIQPGCIIEGDVTQIRQLIHILLDNACKYAGGNGSVSLQLTAQQNTAQLSLLNSGPLIAAEDLPHLFERFYRSDKARTRDGGFGLGLSIAKNIVDSHHGTITAESTEALNGTRFTVQFSRLGKKT